MTQLELVNKILLRLREDQVTTVIENSYAKLIAQFINDAKADLEDINHDWSAYETEISISILAGTRIYQLSETNDRSKLLRDAKVDDRIPLAYDITDAGNIGYQLWDCPLKDIRKYRALYNQDSTDDVPYVFAVQADNTADAGYQIQLLWEPEENRDWVQYWYVPQDDLELDGTDDNTEITLPQRPIELRTYAYALAEREIEQDPTTTRAWQRSEDAIAAALETDMQVQKKSDELDIKNRESL